MSVVDIVSALEVTVFAQVGLVLFLIAFIMLMGGLYRPGHRAAHRRCSMLPLLDAPAVSTRATEQRTPNASSRTTA